MLKYGARYEFHMGILWRQDVPGFSWVYIHTGNNSDQSAGCLLVGMIRDEDRMAIGGSRDAYRKLYQAVLGSAQDGDLSITFSDED